MFVAALMKGGVQGGGVIKEDKPIDEQGERLNPHPPPPPTGPVSLEICSRTLRPPPSPLMLSLLEEHQLLQGHACLGLVQEARPVTQRGHACMYVRVCVHACVCYPAVVRSSCCLSPSSMFVLILVVSLACWRQGRARERVRSHSNGSRASH